MNFTVFVIIMIIAIVVIIWITRNKKRKDIFSGVVGLIIGPLLIRSYFYLDKPLGY